MLKKAMTIPRPTTSTTLRPKLVTTTTLSPTTVASTTIATTISTTTTLPSSKSPEELLGLPELPPQPKSHNSPLFQIRIESANPKSFQTDAVNIPATNEILDGPHIPTEGERWQLIPPVQASKSIVRFRVDPEQPHLSVKVKPAKTRPVSPAFNLKPPVSPFQIVGHVMSEEELRAFPDSPITNIDPTARHRAPKTGLLSSFKRTGKSGEGSHFGIPLQLSNPGGGLPAPLVWISPASLARSPMVNLSRLPNDGHHVRPANVERALTMVFPGRQRRRFEKSCLTCLSSGGACPHCLVVKR